MAVCLQLQKLFQKVAEYPVIIQCFLGQRGPLTGNTFKLEVSKELADTLMLKAHNPASSSE
jgi:hypothetical protein